MFKKGLNIFTAALLLLLLFRGTSYSHQALDEVNFPQISVEKKCSMDCCGSRSAACPLCMTSYSIGLFFLKKAELYIPILSYSVISIDLDTLSDQGFLKSICHPPPSIL